MASDPILIKGAYLVNEGRIFQADVLMESGKITRIDQNISGLKQNYQEIQAEGKYLLPGIIDNHVHFREPGLTHKGNIRSESAAAVAGGVTSFMEMPNTNPQTVSLDRLWDKYDLADHHSYGNYAFYLGATNDNLEEIKRANTHDICGIKIFMGSSTGNMLVDNEAVLSDIFGKSKHLIAIHAEDETKIAENWEAVKAHYETEIPIEAHPKIRDEEACYIASDKAIKLAREKRARLHVLHLTTGKEISLFDNQAPSGEKMITTEACVHHLYFSSADYTTYGNKIKCFPAIKDADNRKALWQGLLDGHIDQIASDHSPHTMSEKQQTYLQAPGGIPMIQFNLPLLLEQVQDGHISLPTLVGKMAHNPAINYNVQNRGFLREGYQGDCVLVDFDKATPVNQDTILSLCQWSPFENQSFSAAVTHTFVNGSLIYNNGQIIGEVAGEPLSFSH